VVNGVWVVAVIPALPLKLTVGVTTREERYLDRRFGEQYRSYPSRVRRWI
jgi:protein-S-isoprenylcysteine O-methyltransferase Ste14